MLFDYFLRNGQSTSSFCYQIPHVVLFSGRLGLGLVLGLLHRYIFLRTSTNFVQ